MRSTSKTLARGVTSRAHVAAAVVLVLVAAACAGPQSKTGQQPVFVAHAGGLGAHRTYTNSLEALDHSVSAGHTLIEVDFSWTSDDHLVLFHDWADSVERLLDGEPARMTLADFQSATSPWGLTHLVLDDLGQWLTNNPGCRLVTDIKDRNIEGLRRIADAFPNLLDRFVPQIYALEEYAQARDIGYDDVILTLYRSDLTDDQVVTFTGEHGVFAVTMPLGRARATSLPERLASAGVPVYVHTINDYLSFDLLKTIGVFGVYTDWLSPADNDLPVELADWTSAIEHSDPLEDRLTPYLPPAIDGLRFELAITNRTPQQHTIQLRAFDDRGREAGDTSLQLSAGESQLLDLHRVFPRSAFEGWFRILADDAVEVDLRSLYHGEPGPGLVVAATSGSRLVTRGPGTGMGGHLLAIVNPGPENQTYRVSRSIGDDLVDQESIELSPSHQAIRVFNCRTEEVIQLVVEGGPMVAQTLRWDPFLRTMR